MAKFGFSSNSTPSTSSAPSFGFTQPSSPFATGSTAPQPIGSGIFGSSTPNSAPSPSGFGCNGGLFGSTTSPSLFGTASAAPSGSTGLFGTDSSSVHSPFGPGPVTTSGSTSLFDSGTSFVPSKTRSFSTGKSRPCVPIRSRNSTSGLGKVAAAIPRESFTGAPPSNSLTVSSPAVVEVPIEDEDKKSDAISEGSDRDDVQGVSPSSMPPMTSLPSQVHDSVLKESVSSLAKDHLSEATLGVENQSTKEVGTETSESKHQSELNVCLKPEVVPTVETQTIKDVVNETLVSKDRCELSLCMKPEAAPVLETHTTEEAVNETSDSTHQSKIHVCLEPEAAPVVETQTTEKFVNETSDSEHQSPCTICLKIEAPPLLESKSAEDAVNETSDSEHQSGISEAAPMVESQSTIKVANETSDSLHQSEVSGQNESSNMSLLSLIPLELALSSQKIPSMLNGPILQQILKKYGDITKGSTLKSWEAKAVFVQLVVEAVKILNARTIDTIEAEEIQTVQKWTDDASAVGFHVGWLQQRIKEIVANSNYQKLQMQFDKITEQIGAAKVALLEMEMKQMDLKKEIDLMNAEKDMDHLYKSELSAGLL